MPLRTALWGDAATEVPWTAYQRYGDLGLLEAQYPSMRRWLETILAHCDPPGPLAGALPPRRLAGPCRPSGQPRRPGAPTATWSPTPGSATRPGSWSRWPSCSARTPTPTRFRDAEAAARADFASRYVHPDGTMTSDSQTAHALAIHFDLVDGDRRAATGRRLVELVEQEGHRIGTGFAGTPDPVRRAVRRSGPSTPPTGCCCRPRRRRGCTRCSTGRRRSGSGGTASAPTAPATRAR